MYNVRTSTSQSHCQYEPFQPGVGESRWAFKTTFEVSESDLSPSYADLVFDGLDTFATVQLVSSLIPGHGPGSLILASS